MAPQLWLFLKTASQECGDEVCVWGGVPLYEALENAITLPSGELVPTVITHHPLPALGVST